MPGVFSNCQLRPDPATCFVMMPFAESFSAIYRLIQRCCTEQGLACVRADEDVRPGKITGKIYDLVSSAGVIIADMTGRNPNVFYELGLAHAISDNVILLTQATEDVPFDLKDFIHIRYVNTFEGAETLAKDLSKALTTLLRSAEVHLPPDDLRRERQPADLANIEDEEIDLGLLHLQADIVRSRGDMKEAFDWLQKALEAARDGKGDAPEVGNCAIEAERCRFLDLAESLYELALTRDPSHVNNRQSYISFLLDHRAGDPRRMEIAGQMLDELESVSERMERTRGLRAQYMTIIQRHSGEQVNVDEIVAELVGDGDFKSLEQAAPALIVLQQARRFGEMRDLIERLRPRVPATSQMKLDRILADAFADSEDRELQEQAIALYDRLLDQGADHSTDVKHNLATLLWARDRDDNDQRALKLWSEAYAERPGDPSIRKAFAHYLVRRGQEDDAAKVLAGQPITL